MTKKTVQTFELEKIDPNSFPELKAVEAKLAEMQKRNDALEEEQRLAREEATKKLEVVEPEKVEETEIQEVDFEYPKPEMIPLGDTDLTTLQEICQNYIDYVDSPEYHEDNDFKQYIFETAIETFFGKDAWDFINNRRK